MTGNALAAIRCIIIGCFVASLNLYGSDQVNSPSPDIEQSLEQAMRFCDGLDPTTEALARQGGYDIRKLCNSLSSVQQSLQASGSDPSSEFQVLPRAGEAENTNGQLQTEVSGKELGAELGASQGKMQREDFGAAENLAETATAADRSPTVSDHPLFGYDLFAGEPTSYQPTAMVPVEADYILGPGDELRVQFYGKINDLYELPISRDGAISFPKIGPLGLAGLTFSEAKQLISEKVSEQHIGVKFSVSMGDLRSMHIFVLGEAYKPGTYTVPSLSTITNVLFLSGGVTDIASLRNIQLKRDGKVSAVLDLYDLLLKGDRADDVRLQAGDTIFIPSIERTASIAGQIRRPAMYELNPDTTVQQLIELGGGLLPEAYRNRARIHRVDSAGFMTVVDIDLNTQKGLNTEINSGDRLVIDRVADKGDTTVTVVGNLHHPGASLWRPGLKISDLVGNYSALKPKTDLDFALLRREQRPTGKISSLFVDLGAVLADRDSEWNIQLQPRDQLMIFSNQPYRAQLFEELIEELRLQSRLGETAQIVSIEGSVHSPGDYPLTQAMRLTQLVAAAGGLKEQAYTQAIEISRFDLSDGQQVKSSHQIVDLAKLVAGQEPDILLQPGDMVSIRVIPEYKEKMFIKLEGEVRLPGIYNFLPGETLSQVIQRAGGLTAGAYPQAAVFTRRGLREQEQKRLDELNERLQADLATVTIESDKTQNLEHEQELIAKLQDRLATGRLVIDLKGMLSGSVNDILIKHGDRLVVPEYSQEVSVIGQVQWPSSHQFDSRLGVSDYVRLAGGTDVRADKKRIYVIRVDGSVQMPKGSAWFKHAEMKLTPGDTVVVPLDVDRRRAMDMWREASGLIYQLSLGAAAVKVF